MAPSRTPLAALALLLAAAPVLTAPAPAQAEYDPDATFTTETFYTAGGGNFNGRDASLALRPDGTYVAALLTPVQDTTYPETLLARPGVPGSWGPVEVITDDPDDAEPASIEVFPAPDGSVVALWQVHLDDQHVLRSAVRAPGGGWSEPAVVATGVLNVRQLVRQATGATLVWTTSGVLHARTWAAGTWGPERTTPALTPQFADSYAIADRPSDGQVTVAIADTDENVLRIRQLDPGEDWSEPVLSHPKLSSCEVDVGVLDQYGTIKAVVTLCYQSYVTGYPGAVYAPNGDLHLWWNSWSGMNRVQGVYPNHQVVCDCTHGISGGVFPGGDLAPDGGVATGLQSGALLPGMPRSVERRSFHKVWDADGDLTMFVGGLGEAGRTINAYRDGDTFADPVATFQAPGSPQSSRSGYVVDTFTSGDDILIGYQHTAPASNLGPGGSCNTRVLHADDTLSGFLGACLDGNTTDWTAVQEPDGSLAVASGAYGAFSFRRLAASAPSAPAPVAPAITVTGPAPSYGAAGSVVATVTGAGVPATGTVRLRYGGTVLATSPLGPGGSATLPLGRTALPPGSRVVTVDYLGSASVLAGSASRILTVGRATPRAPAVTVPKKPTSTKPGKVRVRVAAPASGLAVPAGPVTVVLRKGGQTKHRAGTLSGGAVTLTVPKLAKGTWRLTASYAGNAWYLPRTAPAVNLKVTR